MRTKKKEIGNKYGLLTILEEIPLEHNHYRRVIASCECGSKNKSYSLNHLRQEKIKSCGCLRVKRQTKHGKSKSKIYRVWCTMKQRCYNHNYPDYKNYGAKGIKVCEEWLTFENFLEDIGDKPFNLVSLDRIDNNGDYEKSNIRWASYNTQAQNRSSTKLNPEIVREIRSKTLSKIEKDNLCKLYNISKNTLHDVIKNRTWKNI